MAEIYLRGAKKHLDRLRKLQGRAMVEAANSVVYEGADIVRAKAHYLISQGSVSGKGHVPSKPGEPPNRDTGNLQAHIEASNPKPLVGRVTSSADYAAALEFGTSKMAARPYMRPARDQSKKRVQALFVKRINEIVKRSG